VQVLTYTRATTYKSIEWFRFDRFSAYVRRGKQWDCIDYALLSSAIPARSRREALTADDPIEGRPLTTMICNACRNNWDAR
jgi:hypothetical protein